MSIRGIIIPIMCLMIGCSRSWTVKSYESATSVSPLVPGQCEVAVRIMDDANVSTSGPSLGLKTNREKVLGSLRPLLTEDVARNVCSGESSVPLLVMVEVRTLAHQATTLVEHNAIADFAVSVRKDDAEIGSYDVEGHGRGGSPSAAVGAAVGLAMDDLKAQISTDRTILVDMIEGRMASRPRRARQLSSLRVGGGSSARGRGTGGRKVNLAVADLQAEGASATDAAVVASLLRGELVRTEAFRVVEKKSMDKILSEQAFQQTGCTQQECAVELGKLLNVERMLVGTVGRLMERYYVSIRVVDVETGETTYADSAKGTNAEEIERAVVELARRMAGAAL